MKRVLISTITPIDGGVPEMVRFCAATLRKGGYEPVLGHYEPYSMSPSLSVPLHKLFQRSPGLQQRTALENLETYAIGAWLPELEFTHFRATSLWRKLLDSADHFMSASGNALASLPFKQTGREYLSWIAAGWEEDRADRVRQFPLPRKILDQFINGPVLRKLERGILASGRILALSNHTRDVLRSLVPGADIRGILPVPVDHDRFVPDQAKRVRHRLGFSGRINDPRKNVQLLLESMAHARKGGLELSAVLIGGEPSASLVEQIERLGLSGQVQFPGYISRDELREMVQSLDLFVLPSHQEGLCISALEAMACAVPVVSTRCGGPEEFVLEGLTGKLVDLEAQEMADAISTIVSDEKLRQQLGRNARDMVVRNYGRAHCETVFWNAFESKQEHKAA